MGLIEEHTVLFDKFEKDEEELIDKYAKYKKDQTFFFENENFMISDIFVDQMANEKCLMYYCFSNNSQKYFTEEELDEIFKNKLSLEQIKQFFKRKESHSRKIEILKNEFNHENSEYIEFIENKICESDDLDFNEGIEDYSLKDDKLFVTTDLKLYYTFKVCDNFDLTLESREG